MTDTTLHEPPRDRFRRLRAAAAFGPRVLAAATDRLLSARGLALLFLAVAAMLTVSGWLRPPLTTDIGSQHISLGLWPGASAAAEILGGPRRVVPDSIAVILLVALAASAAIVVWRPDRIGLVAGVLLALGLAGNAVAALNHPLLIQLLDGEYEQRTQMTRALATVAEDAMPEVGNGRLGIIGLPTGTEQPGDPLRGALYLLYGRWFVLWAAVGVVCGVAGTLGRRLRVLALSLAAGAALGALACAPRLYAEYHWNQARTLEGERRFQAARASLERAVAAFPEFAQLERTWLLTGKLDHLTGRRTPASRYFEVYQLIRDKERTRTVAFQEDLPWVVPGTRDPRDGTASGPSTFNALIATGQGTSGTEGYRRNFDVTRPVPTATATNPDALAIDGASPALRHPRPLATPGEHAYQFARARAPHIAVALLEQLRKEPGGNDFVVRQQLARVWLMEGLTDFAKSGPTDQPRKDEKYFWRETYLVAAQTAWEAAAAFQPDRRDVAFLRGMVHARLTPDDPERTAALLEPARDRLGDQIMMAELLTILGDAYFEGGQGAAARLCYALSFDKFCLPKVINTRAQERLGGR